MALIMKDAWIGKAVLTIVVLMQAPIFLWADYQQAIIYYNRGLYEKAIQEIKPDVDAHPNDWEPGHRILGLCYVNTKQYAQAISALTKAVQLKSPVFSTYKGLSIAYWETSQWGKVVAVLTEGERLAKSADELYELAHWRGSANYRQKRYPEAIRDLREAFRIRNSEVSDITQLGFAYYYTQRFDDAVETLNKAASLKPGDAAVQDILARSYQKRGAGFLKDKQYAKAVDDLTKALSYNAKDGAAHYNLGMSQLLLNKYDEAERALARAAELIPTSPDAFQQLGYVYEKKKQYGKALDSYRKAYDISKSAELKASMDRVAQAAK